MLDAIASYILLGIVGALGLMGLVNVVVSASAGLGIRPTYIRGKSGSERVPDD